MWIIKLKEKKEERAFRGPALPARPASDIGAQGRRLPSIEDSSLCSYFKGHYEIICAGGAW